jgi:hypothetical protein
MSTHDAGYLQLSHRAPGIPAREMYTAPELPRQAVEPRRLEQLPWPRNLFGELASIAELMAESEHADENAGHACSCGCHGEHRHNISQMLWNLTVGQDIHRTGRPNAVLNAYFEFRDSCD